MSQNLNLHNIYLLISSFFVIKVSFESSIYSKRQETKHNNFNRFYKVDLFEFTDLL